MFKKYLDINDDQRQQLYSMALPSTLGFGLLAFLVSIILYKNINPTVLYMGMALHLCIVFYRIYVIYLNNKEPGISNYKWIFLYNIGVFLSAVIWSATVIYISFFVSVEYQYLLYTIIIGLAGAGIASLGSVLFTYMLFLVSLTFPVIIFMILKNNFVDYVSATLYFIMTGYYLLGAYQIYIGQKRVIDIRKRMDLAFEGSRDAIWDWNLVDNSLYISSRWKDIIGFSDFESYDKLSRWKSCIHPDDYHTLMKNIINSKNGKTEYLDNIHRVKHKNGHWIWIHLRGKAQFDNDKKALRMTGTLSDVTNETNLKYRNTQLAQIIEQTNDAIISTDLDGNITSWNNGTTKLLGYLPHEIISQHISCIYPEKYISTFDKSIQILLQEGKYTADTYLKDKYNNIIPVALSLSLLRDERGNPTNMIGYIKDITQRKDFEKKLLVQKQKLKFQANHDDLTGLPNRALFIDRLKQGIFNAKRNKKTLALFFIDLDHFKEINDTLGHNIGDKVLKKVATLLKQSFRKEDTLARLGGDEFTIITQNLATKEDIAYLAQKVLSTFKEPIIIDSHTLYVTSSMGISLYPDDGESCSNLLQYADTAMYKAKNEGRNNFQFYDIEMTRIALERITLERNLRYALQNNEFTVYYQPQMDAKKNNLVGMEALVRWKHPEMGLIPPDKFIPLAEATGLIIEIDLFVMRSALSQIVQWYKEGLNPGVLALNLAVKQLENRNFLKVLEKLLEDTKCKREWIELEVTEGQIMKNPEYAIDILNKISALGINLAIDDFGTGYSSLAYLKRLPINKLKIDQSFVRELPDDEEDVAIVKAVIALAESLNLRLIAEGVESKKQKEFLVEHGCTNIQGYFYSKPIPAEEMKMFLSKEITV